MLGVLFGLALHFWRDLSEPGTGVALLWPFSDHSFSTSHASYLILMAMVVAVAALRTPEVGRLYRRLARRRLPTVRAHLARTLARSYLRGRAYDAGRMLSAPPRPK